MSVNCRKLGGYITIDNCRKLEQNKYLMLSAQTVVSNWWRFLLMLYWWSIDHKQKLIESETFTKRIMHKVSDGFQSPCALFVKNDEYVTYHFFQSQKHGSKGPFRRCDFFWVRLRFFTLHGTGCMDVNDTVHTVRLRFDFKMQSHWEKKLTVWTGLKNEVCRSWGM